MPLSFMDQTVEVLRAPLVESRGSLVPDWDAAERHEVGSCLVTDAGTSQDRDGRSGHAEGRKVLRAPYGADVRAGDRVVCGGETYEVDGEVHRTESPTGRASSLKCELAAWKG